MTLKAVNHHQGGFAQSSLKLALGEVFKGPFVESSEPSNKQSNSWKDCTRCYKLHGYRYLWHNRQFAAKGFPAVEVFIGGSCATGYYTGNNGGSFTAARRREPQKKTAVIDEVLLLASQQFEHS